jgi:hypothetical protein
MREQPPLAPLSACRGEVATQQAVDMEIAWSTAGDAKLAQGAFSSETARFKDSDGPSIRCHDEGVDPVEANAEGPLKSGGHGAAHIAAAPVEGVEVVGELGMLLDKGPVVEAADADKAIVSGGESPPAGYSGIVGGNVSLDASGKRVQAQKRNTRVLKYARVGQVLEEGMFVTVPERPEPDLSEVNDRWAGLLFDEGGTLHRRLPGRLKLQSVSGGAARPVGQIRPLDRPGWLFSCRDPFMDQDHCSW